MLIEVLLGCVTMTGIQMENCIPIVNQIVEVNEIVEETKPIRHLGYSEDSVVQDYVNRAYMLWWIEFVKTIECENGRWDPYRWSNTKDYGLCQVNIPLHKVPDGFYDDPYIQLDYCYGLRANGIKFYGPSRKINWRKCSEYVKDRFLIE